MRVDVPWPPIEPPANRWTFPTVERADDHGLVCVGGDLAPGTLVAAYRSGLFPMPVARRTMGWWSPDPRGVLPLDAVHVSRTLRRSARRFTISVDTAFADVMRACGDSSRPHGWITRDFVAAYSALHHLGWAHSVEVWDSEGVLVGGVYGIAIGRFFAGESMFHRATDASKVALVALTELLAEAGFTLFDVQWQTPHLTSLGVVEIGRDAYLDRLVGAVAGPTPRLSGAGPT